MGLTRITSDGITDGTITGTDLATNITLSGNLSFADDKFIKLGAGEDLKLTHTGSRSEIHNITGDLLIRADSLKINNAGNTEELARFTADGAVELYYDNDRKIRTISNGCQVESASGDTFLVVRAEGDDASTDAILRLSVQNASATSIIQFGDQDSSSVGQILYEHADNSMRFRTNGSEFWRITSAGHLESNNDTGRIKLGASDDLQIYHDGSNSYIKEDGTGGLYQQTNGNGIFLQKTDGENMANFVTDGAVELYYNNEKMFETEADGVKVFDNNESVHVRLVSSAGDAGFLYGASNTDIGLLTRDGSYAIRGVHDGTTELYYDGNKKFETTANGVTVTGNITCDGINLGDNELIQLGNSNDLRIYHDSGINYIGSLTNQSLVVFTNNASRWHFQNDGHFRPNSDSSVDIGTNSVRVRNAYVDTYYGDGSNLTGITSQGKNLIINGGMRIHQRGTASYTLNSGNQNDYVVDRFKVNSGSGTIVASQDTTVPDGQGFSNSIKLDCTVADSNPNSEGYIQYLPEAQNFYHLAYGTSGAKAITVSFWVKSALAATYGFYYYVPDAGPRVYQTSFAISSANTWEKKTITIPGDTAGNGFANDNGIAAEIRIYFYSTTAQQGTSNQNSWGTNSSNRIPSGTNLVSSTSNDFFFTGFQIEVGSQATDYDFCSYAKELSYCQRYYWKIATNTYRRVNGYKRHDANSFWEVKCPVPMRTAPSPTLLAGGTFTNFQSNFNTTQTSPVVNEWNTDTGMGLLHVQSTWGDTHKTIPSWEGYSIEFSSEF